MKKIFYILLLSLTFQASAQRFNAGISAGFVASDVYGADIVPDADAWNDADFRKAGFMFGGTVNTALSKELTLNAEFNYIQKGTQQHADINGNGYYKFSFNYLEFPVILKYRLHFNIGKKPADGFDIHAGISLGKLIANKAEGDNFYSNNDDTYLNKTDVSLLAGLGYNFSEHVSFCFRYSNSIIPVFKSNSVSPALLTSTNNNGNSIVLNFIFQYMFGAGKNNPPPVNENNIQ